MVLITPVQIHSIWRSFSSSRTMKFNTFISARKSFCRVNSKVCWNKAAFRLDLIFRMRDKRIDSFLEESHQCDSMFFNLSFILFFHLTSHQTSKIFQWAFISLVLHFQFNDFIPIFKYATVYLQYWKEWEIYVLFSEAREHKHILLILQQRETIMLVVTFPFVVRLHLLHSCV